MLSSDFISRSLKNFLHTGCILFLCILQEVYYIRFSLGKWNHIYFHREQDMIDIRLGESKVKNNTSSNITAIARVQNKKKYIGCVEKLCLSIDSEFIAQIYAQNFYFHKDFLLSF